MLLTQSSGTEIGLAALSTANPRIVIPLVWGANKGVVTFTSDGTSAPVPIARPSGDDFAAPSGRKCLQQSAGYGFDTGSTSQTIVVKFPSLASGQCEISIYGMAPTGLSTPASSCIFGRYNAASSPSSSFSPQLVHTLLNGGEATQWHFPFSSTDVLPGSNQLPYFAWGRATSTGTSPLQYTLNAGTNTITIRPNGSTSGLGFVATHVEIRLVQASNAQYYLPFSFYPNADAAINPGAVKTKLALLTCCAVFIGDSFSDGGAAAAIRDTTFAPWPFSGLWARCDVATSGDGPGQNQAEDVRLSPASTGGNLQLTVSKTDGSRVTTGNIAWSATDATYIGNINTALNTATGVSGGIVASAISSIDPDNGFTLTYSGTGYAGKAWTPAAVAVLPTSSTTSYTVQRSIPWHTPAGNWPTTAITPTGGGSMTAAIDTLRSYKWTTAQTGTFTFTFTGTTFALIYHKSTAGGSFTWTVDGVAQNGGNPVSCAHASELFGRIDWTGASGSHTVVITKSETSATDGVALALVMGSTGGRTACRLSKSGQAPNDIFPASGLTTWAELVRVLAPDLIVFQNQNGASGHSGDAGGPTSNYDYIDFWLALENALATLTGGGAVFLHTCWWNFSTGAQTWSGAQIPFENWGVRCNESMLTDRNIKGLLPRTISILNPRKSPVGFANTCSAVFAQNGFLGQTGTNPGTGSISNFHGNATGYTYWATQLATLLGS